MIDLDNANELATYARLEGAELGEVCLQLAELASPCRDICSKEFIKALNSEIAAQLRHFKEHCKIERKMVTRRSMEESLVWDDEDD